MSVLVGHEEDALEKGETKLGFKEQKKGYISVYQEEENTASQNLV